MQEVSEKTEANAGKNRSTAPKEKSAPKRETEQARSPSTGGAASAQGTGTPASAASGDAAPVPKPDDFPATDHEPETPTLADTLPVVSDDDDTKITMTDLKEKIMATTPNNNNTNNNEVNKSANAVGDAVAEVQNRTKAAYEKGTEAVTELSDFAKGNVEAMVESTKIVASGLQELGRTYADEARAAYEQLSADMKEMAAIKSPTELFQLQGKIMRRNFDTLVAASSKNSEAMMKLATDAFQPLSGRVNAAVDKASKIS